LTDLRTARLLLRRWTDADLPAFAALNADPRVMRYFAAPLERAASDHLVARIEAHFDAYGFGFWAVEAPGLADLIGMVGLAVVGFEAPFTPCVEIGWRLAQPFWGRGYASEAARRAVRFGFEEAGRSEIVAFTTRTNTPSRRVMERLGMTTDPADDFDHPRLPRDHPLRHHVLYRARASHGIA
jgi:RimJ/RimL family protein N-acetyltransferase